MGGPYKIILGSPCDQLRTHLPPQCQQGPLLWVGRRPDVQLQVSGKAHQLSQVARNSVTLRYPLFGILLRYLTD